MANPPLIIEAAVNGAVSKAKNPHVPLETDEIVASIEACLHAGATLFHLHAGTAVVGAGSRHAAAPYEAVFRRVLERHPDALLYPTLPGGGGGARMPDRYKHIERLRAAGLLRVAPIDPGTMNYGIRDSAGGPPVHDAVYQNTFGDVAYAFRYCIEHSLACTMSIFEPGFLQLVIASRDAGVLPRACMVKFEFASGRRLFGLPPTEPSLTAYLAMLAPTSLPWMVAVRDGDAARELAGAAIERGGHVRVGIEDYGGDRVPRNEELVAEIAALAKRAGREIATPLQAAALLKPKQEERKCVQMS